MMRFTQARGFEDIKEHPFPWDGNEGVEPWAERHGFKSALRDGFDCRELDEQPAVEIYENRTRGCWVAFVEEQFLWREVLVESEADLMAFRVAIAPLLLSRLNANLTEVAVAVHRLFRVQHGHPHDESCLECETSDEHAGRLRLELQRRGRAASGGKQ